MSLCVATFGAGRANSDGCEELLQQVGDHDYDDDDDDCDGNGDNDTEQVAVPGE